MLEVEVEDLKDLQDTLREMHNGIRPRCVLSLALGESLTPELELANRSKPQTRCCFRRADASAKHDDALEEELLALDKKAQNLELYGLTMMEIKKEAGALRSKLCRKDPLSPQHSPGKPIR